MSFIADGLLIFAALAAAFYCMALHRRLNALKRADTGLAARIKELNESLDNARAAIEEARGAAEDEQDRLRALVMEARLLRASMENAPARRSRSRAEEPREDLRHEPRREPRRESRPESRHEPHDEPRYDPEAYDARYDAPRKDRGGRDRDYAGAALRFARREASR